MEFIKCIANPNVYQKQQGFNFFILGLYVNDSILVSNNLVFLNNIKTQLSKDFKMRDNGELHYYFKHISLQKSWSTSYTYKSTMVHSR